MKKKNSNFVNPYQDNIGDIQGTPITNVENNIQNKGLKKPKNQKSNKSKLPLIIGIVVGIIALSLIVIFLIRGFSSKPTPPVETIPPVVTDVVDETETPTPDTVPDVTPDVDTSTPPTDEPEDEGVVSKYSYENDMIGIKFNFNPDLYMKENVADIFNVLKEALPEGRDDFNLYTDKLPSILNIVKLTTGDSDGLYISVSLLPFEIEKETTTLKIDGTTEVVNESIESVNLTDDELIEKYDTQIKQSLTDNNCEIISYDKSSVLPLGDDTKQLKGIITSRVYKGATDITTSTGIVDVIQCTIPVGKNAILITAVTDGSPIEIDKSEIFYEILNSLVVVYEEPIIEELPVETPVITPNNGG